MLTVAENIIELKSSLPEHVKVVAVSKTKPPSLILEAWDAGQRIFGENRVQELLSKRDKVPDGVAWHLIGHLQTNKVKYIVPFISVIESVDSYKLLQVINKEAHKAARTVDCLLQIHIATEDAKFGFAMEEIENMISNIDFPQMKNIRVCGVMGMATFSDDQELVRKEFKRLRADFEYLKKTYFDSDDAFKEVSMGMSGDYRIAVEEGSTIIRVGSLIFGERS
jgi:PLP dependent protein